MFERNIKRERVREREIEKERESVCVCVREREGLTVMYVCKEVGIDESKH